ncbi:MAG TPA: 1-deoxy-D-xylulose-5-phosphate synthase, partial [Desulfobacteraceae bacterium]|nr:1-deoxy-D-xylulose-5-phosphate synthase [Desulfobacteraceae bacterium]
MWQDDYRILNNIEDPKDIKRLSIEELEILAKEIRDKIVKTVSKNGGHLAPNLGAVELTLALHYVFDAPRDKIIWDVGHQSYAHKLITGRRTRFHTLRTYKGISGFPKRSESPYDTFDTGHSSTSISVGLGISSAKSLKGEKAHVVAVIGDGAMTAGMAFEALNQTGHMEKDLIVVLNDNAMSIAPNVGSFSSFISRKMTGKRFVYLRKELRNFLKSIPGVGENIINLIRKSEDSLITFFTPGMLFEAFKFKYVGPINGHRLELLIETFNNVKHLEGPVLVHVTTQKGKGYGPAEENPTLFHGIGPFDIKTGRPIKKRDSPPSYTEIFGKTLVELAEQDKRIVAITAAMPEGAGLHLFRDRFPERFFDVGIAEQHAVTFAAGLATEGLRPVVAIYSTFLQRAYDQIIHDVCLSNLPVVFCLDRSGLVGEDGPTHHGQFDLTYFRNLPRMVVMAPKDEDELRHMLYTALRYKGGPIAIRYPRGEAVGVEMASEFRELPIGKGEILTQGKDLLILAVGSMVQPSIRAHESLNR